MRARVFIEHPEEVQLAIALMIDHLQRPGRSRAIYGKAIRRACRVLKVMAHWEDNGIITWELAKEWKERLKLAGLDPKDPMRIVSQKRWNNAWAQLVETHTFKNDVAQREIATGKRSPKAQAHVKAVALPEKKQGEATFKMPRIGK